MSLTPAFLDELRARTLLSALVGKTVKLQKAGREFKGCCPFHNEKTPSFYVNDDKGFFHCFGCSAHGDAIRWLTDQRGLPFIDAVKELAQAAGMDMPAPDRQSAERAELAKGLHEAMSAAAQFFTDQLNGIAGAEARTVLENRGVTQETARTFGLGYSPDARGRLREHLKGYGDPTLIEAGLLIKVDDKEPYDRFRGRLMIPIRDHRGRVIAFGGRVIGQGEPKYLNSPDTPLFDKGRTLYNLDRAAAASRKAGRVVVVEGYMDVIALDQAGFGEAVAPLGTALTEHQLERLWRLNDVPILCFDGDPAGQKAAIRAASRALPELIPGRSLSFITLPEGLDPDDLIKARGSAAFEELLAEPQALVDRLWLHELKATDLNTPEKRAGLGERLRTHAREIKNEAVRNDYLATYNRMIWDYLHPERPSDSFIRYSKRQATRPIAERLHAIAKRGIDQVTFIPALFKGLINYPDLIRPLAELMVRLPVEAIMLRQTREAMLDAALTDESLDSDGLIAILKAEGLGTVLKHMESVTLAFSFLSHNGNPDQAKKDLTAVADALVGGLGIDEDIEEAHKRWSSSADEKAYAEFEQLLKAKREADDAFREAMSENEVSIF